MAAGNKSGGKDFKPGQSGNPAGRPAAPVELRQAKAKFKQAFEADVIELAEKTYDELKKISSDPAVPWKRAAIARMMTKQMQLADPMRFNFLLDRLVGPVKNAVELSGPDGEPLAPVVAMNSQDLTVTLVAIQKLMKEKQWSFPQSSPPVLESSPASSRRGSRGA